MESDTLVTKARFEPSKNTRSRDLAACLCGSSHNHYWTWQSDPPFIIAQLVVLAVFVALGVMAFKSFHPQGRFGI